MELLTTLPPPVIEAERDRFEEMANERTGPRGAHDRTWVAYIRAAKCTDRVGRQIVKHDADAVCLGEVNVHEFPHAGGEVDGGAAIGDFDLAPRSMHVGEDEQVGGAVALAARGLLPLPLERLFEAAQRLRQ